MHIKITAYRGEDLQTLVDTMKDLMQKYDLVSVEGVLVMDTKGD